MVEKKNVHVGRIIHESDLEDFIQTINNQKPDSNGNINISGTQQINGDFYTEENLTVNGWGVTASGILLNETYNLEYDNAEPTDATYTNIVGLFLSATQPMTGLTMLINRQLPQQSTQEIYQNNVTKNGVVFGRVDQKYNVYINGTLSKLFIHVMVFTNGYDADTNTSTITERVLIINPMGKFVQLSTNDIVTINQREGKNMVEKKNVHVGRFIHESDLDDVYDEISKLERQRAIHLQTPEYSDVDNLWGIEASTLTNGDTYLVTNGTEIDGEYVKAWYTYTGDGTENGENYWIKFADEGDFDLSEFAKSVNGVRPDKNGNITLPTGKATIDILFEYQPGRNDC
ncbi:MAG: hypothetical protein EZS28_037745 [Streblomastix strix]|uniref:Uncharacterized protein n=1 Tax=Streblomastix strix TaxID=222440 RepID=A0A5J4U8P7_9EUKA|nr:MAG: hypothetical protein EZS28_037745 [Streblomastix strix]